MTKSITLSILLIFHVFLNAQEQAINIIWLPSFVGIIEEKNEILYDSAGVIESKKYIQEAIVSKWNTSKFNFYESIEMDSALLYSGIRSSTFNSNKNKSSLSLDLNNYLKSIQNGKWVLLILEGYQRTPKNFKQQTSKGIAKQLLTLGMAIDYPLRSRFELVAIVLDTELQKVLNVNKEFVADKKFEFELFEKLIKKHDKF